MTATPVTLVSALGRPVTNVQNVNGAVPMTVVDALGEPVTLVDRGGEPVTLLNANGTLWAGSETLTLVAHGDSITSDSQPTTPALNYSQRLADYIAARQSLTVTLVRRGIGGHSWNYAWPTSGNPNTLGQDAVINIDPSASATAKLVLFAGTNGLWLNNRRTIAGAALEAADFETYVDARIAAGYAAANIFVVGCMPRETLALRTIHEYNVALEAACIARGCKFVDLTAVPGFFFQSTTVFPDTIHPSDAAHDPIAEAIYDVMYPTAWTPATLATAKSFTLAAWFDASDAATMFVDDAGTVPAVGTDDVGYWSDKSPAARHVTQATTAAKPNRDTFAGIAAVDFASASTQRLVNSSITGFPTNNMTVCIASEAPSNNSSVFITGTTIAAGDGPGIRVNTGFSTVNIGSLFTPGRSGATMIATMAVAFPGNAIYNGSRTANTSNAGTGVAPSVLGVGAGTGGFNMNAAGMQIAIFANVLDGQSLKRMDKFLRDKTGQTSARPTNAGFTDQLTAAVSTLITSNTITVAGLPSGTYVSFVAAPNGNGMTGATWALNGGAYNQNRHLVTNGDTISVRFTTGAGSAVTTDAIFTLGERLYPWRVTTA